MIPDVSSSPFLCACTYVILLTKAERFSVATQGERVGRTEGKKGERRGDEQNFNELSLMTDWSSVMVTLLSCCS